MLGVEVSLCAVRARELSISILDGDNGVLGTSSSSLSSRASRSTRKNSSAALRSNNVGRLITILEHGVGLHERTRSVGRGYTGLGHDATGGHRAQNRRSTATRRRGSNGLRV